MRRLYLFFFIFVLSLPTPLVVERHGTALVVRPYGDPVALRTNVLWLVFDRQPAPTPPVVEGLVTLYGYSETAYGVVSLRAAEYERTGDDPRGHLWLYLRGAGIDGFRERLYGAGYAGVIALKADDVGRDGTAQFWDSERKLWTAPVRVLVLDSLGSGWERLSAMWHPFNAEVRMRWIGDVSKDVLETVGLERLVRRNQSGFVRLALDDAQGRLILWPYYESGA